MHPLRPTTTRHTTTRPTTTVAPPQRQPVFDSLTSFRAALDGVPVPLSRTGALDPLCPAILRSGTFGTGAARSNGHGMVLGLRRYGRGAAVRTVNGHRIDVDLMTLR